MTDYVKSVPAGDAALVCPRYCSQTDQLAMCKTFAGTLGSVDMPEADFMAILKWEADNATDDGSGMALYPGGTTLRVAGVESVIFQYAIMRGDLEKHRVRQIMPTGYFDLLPEFYESMAGHGVDIIDLHIVGYHVDILKDSKLPMWLSTVVDDGIPGKDRRTLDTLYVPTKATYIEGMTKVYCPRFNADLAGRMPEYN